MTKDTDRNDEAITSRNRTMTGCASEASRDGVARRVSLHDDDIATMPTMGRRAVLAGVAATATLGGLGIAARPARAVTDNDTGPHADPGGQGRGRTGITDRDQGPGSDPAGGGRGARGGGRVPNRGERPTGYSDQDPTDPAGYGATPPMVNMPGVGTMRAPYTGQNDRDPTDPAGYGMFRPFQPRGPQYSHCSDRDPGDPIGNGIRCR
jgi:hypothetical protein